MERNKKLFHLVVVLGAGLTGSAAAIACSSSSDDGKNDCPDQQSSCYAHVAVNSDASDEGYAHIAINPDANVYDTGTEPLDAADAADAPNDGNDSG